MGASLWSDVSEMNKVFADVSTSGGVRLSLGHRKQLPHLEATMIKVSSLTSTEFCWRLEKALRVGMLHESRLALGMPQVIRTKDKNECDL